MLGCKALAFSQFRLNRDAHASDSDTRLMCGCLIVAAVALAAPPAAARIVRTTPPPSDTWNPLLPLTLGTSVEFESKKDENEYKCPFLVEYNFNKYLKLTIEPAFVYIQSKSPDVRTVHGAGDTEFSVEYEFSHERRYLPSVTGQVIVRSPTGSNPNLGSPGFDYGGALIFTKDFIFADADLTLAYTKSGDREQPDIFEVALATEIPLGRHFYLIGELVETIEMGRRRNHTEGTLGIGWHVTEQFKVETGLLIRDDGTYQGIVGFEWSFAGH